MTCSFVVGSRESPPPQIEVIQLTERLGTPALSITFSREDQWTSFSEPGKFPLVLDPVVQGSNLTRVLIDGGSGLNLIFASTLAKMGLNYMSLLTPSKAPFYGIVPGNSSTPIGSVTLPVTFGTE